MKKLFRRSRVALLIDALLLPLMIVWSLFWNGLPATWGAVCSLPKDFCDMWKNREWFKGV